MPSSGSVQFAWCRVQRWQLLLPAWLPYTSSRLLTWYRALSPAKGRHSFPRKMWFLPGKTICGFFGRKTLRVRGVFTLPHPLVQALSIGAFAVISGTLGPRPTLATAFRHNSLLLRRAINLPIFTYSPLSRKPRTGWSPRRYSVANRSYESQS